MPLLDALLLDPHSLDVYIAKRTDGVFGSGTLNDPYDGSTTTRFDLIMSTKVSANSQVHIGPGVFETKGYTPANLTAWQPKSGWKIFGSGIGATTLRIMEATIPASMNVAIGVDYNNFLHSFEASDFTVDSNLSNQPIPQGQHWAPVACGAIGLVGRDIRLRRVRAVNFGSYSKGIECFVFTATGAHPGVAENVNNLIEDCIVEQPSESNFDVCTCFHHGGGEADFGFGVLPASYRACVLRNNYANFESKNGVPSQFIGVKSLTQEAGWSARKWRLHTLEPHHRTVDHLVRIFTVIKHGTVDIESAVFNGFFPIDDVGEDVDGPYIDFTLFADPEPGETPPITSRAQIGSQYQALSADGGTATVVEGNRIFNARIAGPYHDTGPTKDQIVRNNFFRDVYGGVNQTIGGQSTPKGGSVLVYDAAKSRAIFTCHEDHGLSVNDTVVISDAAAPPVSGGDWLNNLFNGSKSVTDVIDSKRFAYSMASPPPTNAISAFVFRKAGTSEWKIGSSLIRDPGNSSHAIFTALEPHGVQATDTVEISGAFSWDSSAYRATTFNGTSFTVQSVDGLKFTYGNISSTSPLDPDPIPSPAFEKSGDSKKGGSVILRAGSSATFSTVLPHGFLKRQAVIIDNARVNDSLSNTYNGNYEVSTVPTPTSFSYDISNPPAPVTAGGLPRFGSLWQVRQFTVEDNIIQLTKLTSPSLPGTLGVIAADNSDIGAHPYIYRQTIVRANLIVQPESDTNSYAILLASLGTGIIENNLVSMARANPVSHQSSGSMQYFNNLTTAGSVAPGTDNLTQQRASEMAGEIEAVHVLAMFK